MFAQRLILVNNTRDRPSLPKSCGWSRFSVDLIFDFFCHVLSSFAINSLPRPSVIGNYLVHTHAREPAGVLSASLVLSFLLMVVDLFASKAEQSPALYFQHLRHGISCLDTTSVGLCVPLKQPRSAKGQARGSRQKTRIQPWERPQRGRRAQRGLEEGPTGELPSPTRQTEH